MPLYRKRFRRNRDAPIGADVDRIGVQRTIFYCTPIAPSLRARCDGSMAIEMPQNILGNIQTVGVLFDDWVDEYFARNAFDLGLRLWQR